MSTTSLTKYAPWKIVHVMCTAELPSLELPPGSKGIFLVLWADDIPLGCQLIPAANLPLSNAAVRSLAEEIVAPALQAYRSEGLDAAINDAPGNHSQAILPRYWSRQLFAPATTEDEKELSVSVVVCTRDRPDSLRRTLESLARLWPRPREVIVVDNAPHCDRTRQLVEPFPDVQYVLEPRAGLDVARNTGVRSCVGDVVAFADDDVVVHPGWIRGLRRGFRDPGISAVTGQVLPAELETDAQYLFETYWGFNRGFCPRLYDREYLDAHLEKGVPVWEIGAGANMAFRRDVFRQVGWFDERLDVGAAGCSGDSEFWYRILANSGSCRYEPTALTFHFHRRERASFKRQIHNYMRGHVAALLIQYERHGHRGNRYRLIREMPDYYIRSVLRSLQQRDPRFSTLWEEIAGCFSGLKYYLLNRRRSPTVSDTVRDSGTRQAAAERTMQHAVAPLVSVVIPCFNQSSYLGEAIASVLSQTYQPLEIVVIDDGSTDDTYQVASSFEHVLCIRTNNQGLSAARNAGIRASHGVFMVFLDADDRFLAGAIEAGVNALHGRPNVAFVFGNFRCIHAAGHTPSIESSRRAKRNHSLGERKRNYTDNDHYCSLLQGNYIGMHAAVMYRRCVLEECHGFNETLLACEDYDLYLRVARQYPIFYHGELVAEYRRHAANMSDNSALMLAAALSVLDSQREGFNGDSAKWAAYQSGVQFWSDYYGCQSRHDA